MVPWQLDQRGASEGVSPVGFHSHISLPISIMDCLSILGYKDKIREAFPFGRKGGALESRTNV